MVVYVFMLRLLLNYYKRVIAPKNILKIHADLRTGATFLNVSVPAAETVYVIDTAW